MIPKSEIEYRLNKVQTLLDKYEPDWSVAVITKKISIYYLTGTLATGVLWLNRGSTPKLFVRVGFERAAGESPLEQIHRYTSYRDIKEIVDYTSDSVLLEKSTMTLSGFELFNKHFSFKETKPLEQILSRAMSVKTDYEIERLRKAGSIHQKVFEEIVPTVLSEGMTEAELGSEVLRAQIGLGSHGLARFQMADTDVFLGYLSFSENGLIPTNFDGPDGTMGNCPAVPCFGNPDRRLRSGDTVFIDTACGYDGYHTDKTSLYTYGNFNNPEAEKVHNICVEIQEHAASLLKPGAIPSEIYNIVTSKLSPGFLEGFMGCPSEQAGFLGHGVGLHVDEYPVIANKFDEPLEENMVIALEPKKGIPVVGMLGTENTFLVTNTGGVSLTGIRYDIIKV